MELLRELLSRDKNRFEFAVIMVYGLLVMNLVIGRCKSELYCLLFSLGSPLKTLLLCALVERQGRSDLRCIRLRI